jgi:hypothetical protein
MSGRFSLTQGISLGPTGTLSSINMASLPIDAVVGQSWQQDGVTYKLVKFAKNAVDSVVGGAAYYTDAAAGTVTMAHGSAQTNNSVAGGFLTAGVTDTYYTVIQTGGVQTGVSVDGSTTAGRTLSQGATDGQLVSTAVGTATVNLPVAVALTAVSGGTATVSWKSGNL